MSEGESYLHTFINLIAAKGMLAKHSGNEIVISHSGKVFRLNILKHQDLIVTAPAKLASFAQSQLGLNKRVFARNCEIKKITKPLAGAFFNAYHLMSATQSAYNYGLFYKTEMVGAASFSKGRKMKRLSEDKRSFELIRYCCKEGITVTGGLSKLVRNFCRDKRAGDVMTYIDKQFSEGDSFIKAGFVKHSETEAREFLVNKKTFERMLNPKPGYCPENYYSVLNEGNIKLIYTPEKL